MPFALWTHEAVFELIEKLTRKRLDLRQVGRYKLIFLTSGVRSIHFLYQHNN